MSTRLEAALAELADAIREEVAAASSSQNAPPAMLSVDQAAERIGIGRTALYNLIGRGELRSVRVGRRRLVSEDAIAELARRP